MGVSINGGSPKWMVGEAKPIKMDDFHKFLRLKTIFETQLAETPLVDVWVRKVEELSCA